MVISYQTAPTSASISDELASKNCSDKDGFISQETVEDIKGRASLTQILESRGHTVKNKRTHCFLPGHEDQHPSMSVDDEKGWYCHVCQEGGHIIEAIQTLDSCNFQEAVETLARETNTTIEYERQPSIAYSKKKKAKGSKKPQPAQLPEIKFTELAQLPAPGEPPQSEKLSNGDIKTTYQYSETQKVVRTDYKEPLDGREKRCLPKHLINGKWKTGSGDSQWVPYRSEEILDHAVGKWLLWLEGEKCVDLARSLSLIATTQVGAGWSLKKVKETLQILKELGIAGIITWADNDDTGFKKENDVIKGCDSVGMPFISINPKRIWENIPEKGDIADWIEAHPDMNQEDFIKRLEEEIHQALEDKKQAALLAIEEALTEEPLQEIDLNCIADTTPERHLLETEFKDNWIVIGDSFYKYSGKGYWKMISDTEVRRIITRKLKSFYQWKRDRKVYNFATQNKLKSCFEFVRSDLSATEFELGSNNHLRAFLNCTVDLRTGDTLPHDPKHFLTSAIDAKYELISECPKLLKNFIIDSYGEEYIQIFRAITSMFLDPTAPYGKFPYIKGPSGSGKGVTLELWGLMFPENMSKQISDFALLNDGDKRHRILSGASLVTVPDAGGFLKGLRSFYELVDNGAMTGRALFSNVEYSRKWNCRFAIASVEHLQLENAGDGWNRRCIILPTKNRTSKTDPFLKQKLTAIKGEIISWAISMNRQERDEILMESHQNEVIRQIQNEAAIQGDSIRAFIDSCLLPSENVDDILYNGALHDAYQDFCKKSGYQPQAMAKFINHLKNVIPNHYLKRTSKMQNGKKVNVPARFASIQFSESISVTSLSNPEYGDTTLLHTFDKSKSVEGGLEEFEFFANNRITQGYSGQNTSTQGGVSKAKMPMNTELLRVTHPTQGKKSLYSENRENKIETENLNLSNEKNIDKAEDTLSNLSNPEYPSHSGGSSVTHPTLSTLSNEGSTLSNDEPEPQKTSDLYDCSGFQIGNPVGINHRAGDFGHVTEVNESEGYIYIRLEKSEKVEAFYPNQLFKF